MLVGRCKSTRVTQARVKGRQEWETEAAPPRPPFLFGLDAPPTKCAPLCDVRTTSRPPKWIKPQLTRLVDEAPGGDGWLHEIKHDGDRMHARIDGRVIKLLTRTGRFIATDPQEGPSAT